MTSWASGGYEDNCFGNPYRSEYGNVYNGGYAGNTYSGTQTSGLPVNPYNNNSEEQIQALVAINAKLQSDLNEQKMFIKNVCEIILPGLPPNVAENLRVLMQKGNMYHTYGW